MAGRIEGRRNNKTVRDDSCYKLAAVPYRFVVLYVIYCYSMTPISSGTMKSASVQALISSTV